MNDSSKIFVLTSEIPTTTETITCMFLTRKALGGPLAAVFVMVVVAVVVAVENLEEEEEKVQKGGAGGSICARGRHECDSTGTRHLHSIRTLGASAQACGGC
jgi:hypothetical protein